MKAISVIMGGLLDDFGNDEETVGRLGRVAEGLLGRQARPGDVRSSDVDQRKGIIARVYGGQPLTAVQIVLVTTTLALFTIPAWIQFGLRWLGV